MNVGGFIAGRLRFKGRVAVWATAISFFVIIIAVAVAGGFSREIRSGVAEVSGDILISDRPDGLFDESDPMSAQPSFLEDITSMKGVAGAEAVIYRTGILQNGDDIRGAIFKGDGTPLESGCMSLPSKLADELKLKAGDKVKVWFVSQSIKNRTFEVADIYDSLIDSDEALVVRVSAEDLRKLNGWDSGEASAIEVELLPSFRGEKEMRHLKEEIGSRVSLSPDEEESGLMVSSARDRFPQLFDWLELLDFNVAVILVLMTLVAGFNMISGLLILLFRSTSTIGTLKTLGMSDRAIAGVFLRTGARISGTGLAIGNAAALLLCAVQGWTHFLKLAPANYFVSYVPVEVDLPEILLYDAIAFIAIQLLLLIPSLFISKVDPSETVKAE